MNRLWTPAERLQRLHAVRQQERGIRTIRREVTQLQRRPGFSVRLEDFAAAQHNHPPGKSGDIYLLDALVGTDYNDTEGRLFEDRYGHLYRVFSTVQGAIDGTVSLARPVSIGIYPGLYPENLSVTDTEVHLLGAVDPPGPPIDIGGVPGHVHIKAPNAGNAPTLELSSLAGSCTARNIVFENEDAAEPCVKLGVSQSFFGERCHFNDSPIGIENNGVIWTRDCVYENCVTGIDSRQTSPQSRGDIFYSCDVGIILGAGGLLLGAQFLINADICIQLEGLPNDVRIESCFATLPDYFVKSSGDLTVQDVIIANNHVNSWSVAFMDLTGAGDTRFGLHTSFHVFGNTGLGGSGTTAMILDEVENARIHNQEFGAISGGITWKSGGGHPTNQYWDNFVEYA